MNRLREYNEKYSGQIQKELHRLLQGQEMEVVIFPQIVTIDTGNVQIDSYYVTIPNKNYRVVDKEKAKQAMQNNTVWEKKIARFEETLEQLKPFLQDRITLKWSINQYGTGEIKITGETALNVKAIADLQNDELEQMVIHLEKESEGIEGKKKYKELRIKLLFDKEKIVEETYAWIKQKWGELNEQWGDATKEIEKDVIEIVQKYTELINKEWEGEKMNEYRDGVSGKRK